MNQPTFSDLEYPGKKRKTRRELFLERMDGLIPWQKLEDQIRPFYPKAGKGRYPYPLPVMLRIHCVQLFYNLSDPGMEDLLYESDPIRRFVGLKRTGPRPDATTTSISATYWSNTTWGRASWRKSTPTWKARD